MIIAIAQQKGGVGKTTAVANLSAIAAKEFGKKVLAVDMDPQGTLTLSLGYRPSKVEMTIADVFLNEAAPPILKTEMPNIDLIPSNPDLATAEDRMRDTEFREYGLTRALKKISGYDLILVDCPPSLGLLTKNVFVAADHVFAPVEPSAASSLGITQLIESIGKISKAKEAFGMAPLKLDGVFLNRTDNRSKLTAQELEFLKGSMPTYLMETMIRNRVIYTHVIRTGKPAVEWRASEAIQDFTALYNEMQSRIN